MPCRVADSVGQGPDLSRYAKGVVFAHWDVPFWPIDVSATDWVVFGDVQHLHPQYLPVGGSGAWKSPSAVLMPIGLDLPLPILMPTLATTKMPAVATARLAAIRPIPTQSTRLGYLGRSFPMPRRKASP